MLTIEPGSPLWKLFELIDSEWLSASMTVAGALLIAVLAHRSPTKDWEWIRDGPDRFFAYAFMAFSFVKSVPHWVAPRFRVDCPQTGSILDPHVQCTVGGTAGHYETTWTFVDVGKEFLWHLADDMKWAAVACALGFALNRLLRWLHPVIAIEPEADKR